MTFDYEQLYTKKISEIRNLVSRSNLNFFTIGNEAFELVSKTTNEKERISFIKLLVALLPTTKSHVDQLLTNKNSDIDFENHFTLFCFLDQVVFLPEQTELIDWISNKTEEYLLTTHNDRAFATFMAGDFLGDHWIQFKSFPILKRVLIESENDESKKSAVFGLIKYYERFLDESVVILFQNFLSNKKDHQINLIIEDFLKKINSNQ
jgi:hypothetical protein